MKIFWAWQSDIEPSISRNFVKKSLENVIEELNKEAIFSDREAEIDHDTKDIPGSPPITDTIFQKISTCDIFVADITPISETDKGKKVMNPNVAIELGYATSKLGNEKIITVMNDYFGSIDDLPFDLKHKRGPILYSLPPSCTQEDKSKAKKDLNLAFKNAIKMQSINNSRDSNNIILDKNGQAIFFDPGETIFRESDDNWGLVKNVPHSLNMESSYFYIKVIPQPLIQVSKKNLKELMYKDGKFMIRPLLASPSNTPVVNKFGAVVVSFGPGSDPVITDITQILTSGIIIGISNSFLSRRGNKIPLQILHHELNKHLKSSLELIKNIVGEKAVKLKIEIGLVNNDECTILMPPPADPKKYYPEPERGPLEDSLYVATKEVEIFNAEEEIGKLLKTLVVAFFDDMGIEFDFEYHKWS